MTKEIQLTKGFVALVSDDWYEYLSQWKWNAEKHHGCYYARRNERMGGRNKAILMHRVVANAPAHLQVDHIDRNTLNNTSENLRLCTAEGNNRNKSTNKTNTTGYKGVYRAGKRYRAQLKYFGKSIKLGTHDNPVEAAMAYDRKAKELHGEFACLNFPDPPLAGEG